MRQKSVDINEYLQVVFHRKKVFITVTLVTWIAILVVAVRLPDIYEASALVLVQEQQLLNPVAKELKIQSPLESRLATIKEQMLSHKFLFDVIKTLGVAEQVVQPQKLENLIGYLRKNLQIEKKGKEELFKISFQGHNPEMVRNVVEEVVSKYIAENQKEYETQFASTIQFLELQAEEYEKKLADSSQALRQYKEEHLFELPSEPNPNMERLGELQSKLVATQLELKTALREQEFLTKQVAMQKGNLISEEASGIPEVEALKTELQEKQLQLSRVLSDLTEEHWTVKALREDIKAIKDQLEKPLVTQEGATTSPLYLSLQKKMDANEVKIASLTANIQDIEKLIQVYENRIAAMPKREQELARLTQQQSENEEMYRFFREKLESAKVSARIEAAGQGTVFEIYDPPRLPKNPVKPSRKKIALIGLVIALGAGLGFVFLIEFLDHSFQNVEEVRTSLNLPILGTVQRFFTKVEIERMKKRKRQTLIVASVIIIFLAIAMAIIITQYPHLLTMFRQQKFIL